MCLTAENVFLRFLLAVRLCSDRAPGARTAEFLENNFGGLEGLAKLRLQTKSLIKHSTVDSVNYVQCLVNWLLGHTPKNDFEIPVHCSQCKQIPFKNCFRESPDLTFCSVLEIILLLIERILLPVSLLR